MSDAPTDSLPLPLTQLFLTSCQGTYIRTQLNKCQSIIYLLYDQFVHTRERKMWPEIAQGKSENRRELKLAGAEISERISASGLDSDLFALDTLNLLNISDTILQHLPAEISICRHYCCTEMRLKPFPMSLLLCRNSKFWTFHETNSRVFPMALPT